MHQLLERNRGPSLLIGAATAMVVVTLAATAVFVANGAGEDGEVAAITSQAVEPGSSSTTSASDVTPDRRRPPRIVRFEVTSAPGRVACPDAALHPYETSWATDGADQVSVSGPSGSHRAGPSGRDGFCGAPGQIVSITAAGPGGRAAANVVLD